MADARRDFLFSTHDGGAPLSGRDATRPSRGLSEPRVARGGQWLCLGGAALGALGLFGRIIGSTFLISVLPGQPPMMPNTALGLLLIGCAAALRRRQQSARARRALSLLLTLVVLGIGLGTLAEYALTVDLHIDQLLFLVPGGPYPGRPSPPTCLALSFLAAALLIFDVRPAARARPSEWLVLSAAITAFIGLAGFVFGAGRLYRLAHAPVIGVALPTSLSLLLTSVGLLLQRPAAGVMRIATSPASGGVMLRRLLLPAVVAPILLGLAVLRLSMALGIEQDLPLVVAGLITLIVPVALFLLVVTAAPLNRAEQALRFSEAKSSGILSISADALISIDEGQRITMFNEGAEKIFGYSRVEAIGAPLDMLIPERYRHLHREHVERFARGEGVARRVGERTAAIFGLRKDGVEFPADAAISKLQVGGKRVLTVALRDVTAEKRIENEQRFLAEAGPLLASSLDYEQILLRLAELAVRDSADFCIVDVIEAEGTPRQLKVASRDPSKSSACDAIARLPRDRETPGLLASVLETDTPVLMPDVTPDAVASLGESEEQWQALRVMAPKSMMVVPLRAHGKSLGLVALISSTRRYEAADLRMAEELARRASLAIENARLYRAAGRAVQARDDVLGIVAHDLRNPLGAILMQAALLRREESKSGQPPRKSSETIERAAKRMNGLIQDLLDVSRMEAGRLSIEPSRVPARQLVSDALESQKPLASSSSIELRLELEEGLGEVWADRDRLLQVFENLVGNALKFTERGGRIAIGAAPRDSQVLFWVSDTGAGIAAEDVPHLFDRFWQASKGGRQGAGLGLPIVKGLVEAHGGSVWVESAPGRGSTFFFTMPTPPEAMDDRSESPPHSPPATTPR